MKNFRNVFTAFAFVAAIGGAFASNLLVPITQGGPFNSTSACVVEALAETTCDTNATQIQCTLASSGALAYRNNAGSRCVTPIFRNN